MNNGNNYQTLRILQTIFHMLVIGLIFSTIVAPFFIYDVAADMLTILQNEKTQKTISITLGVFSFLAFGSAAAVTLVGIDLIGMAIDNRKDIRLIANSLESISNQHKEKKTAQEPREKRKINSKEIPPWSP